MLRLILNRYFYQHEFEREHAWYNPPFNYPIDFVFPGLYFHAIQINPKLSWR